MQTQTNPPQCSHFLSFSRICTPHKKKIKKLKDRGQVHDAWSQNPNVLLLYFLHIHWPFMSVLHKGREWADLHSVAVNGRVLKQSIVRVEQLSGQQEEKLPGRAAIVQPEKNGHTSQRVMTMALQKLFWVTSLRGGDLQFSSTRDHWICGFQTQCINRPVVLKLNLIFQTQCITEPVVFKQWITKTNKQITKPVVFKLNMWFSNTVNNQACSF